MSDTPTLTPEQQAALQQAWNGTVTPYSQIQDGGGITETGQYDFLVGKLEPTIAANGMYAIVGEFPVQAPTGFNFPFRRTLYIGTQKDKLAALPETRLNSPGLRFLKNIAKANNIPTNDQSDAALCQAIVGRAFGNRVVTGKPYTGKDGKQRTGLEFGRNVTPAGLIPAKVDNEQAVSAPASEAAHTNGGAVAGAAFDAE